MKSAQAPPDVVAKARMHLEQLYNAAKVHWPGFQVRDGQKEMMVVALEAFTSHTYPDRSQASRIALIEGQTGSGKTIGYSLPALAAALASGKKVVMSTATIALQEQLTQRDLPILQKVAKAAGHDITVAVLKGRGRYICRERLDDAIEQEDASIAEASPTLATAKKVNVYRSMRDALNQGSWRGDRDAFASTVDDTAWQQVQADRATCVDRACPQYDECGLFKSRSEARNATIMVVNHALLLSLLAFEGNALDLSEVLLVIDEGHHLPDIASDQLAARFALLGSSKHLRALGAALERASSLLSNQETAKLAKETRPTLQMLGKHFSKTYALLRDRMAQEKAKTWRFEHGVVPADLREVAAVWGPIASTVLETGQTVHKAGTEQLAGSKGDRAADRKLLKLLEDIGSGIGRIESLVRVAKQWGHEGRVPRVKWIEFTDDADATLCASPLTSAKQLQTVLWNKVTGCVVTSATMTACASFDYYQRLSGTALVGTVRTLVTRSPFDYQKQGELRIPRMATTPKDVAGFTAELQAMLPARLMKPQTGQLVLFSSKRQMKAMMDSLPQKLKERVLMQGTKPNAQILREHRQRIEANQPSIIFGLQSFGEGIDLPGKYLEHVYIEKVPFAVPDTPIESALAEWLAEQKRDAFEEISVPKASQRLAQWTGRGIRTVNDWASITIFDTRLIDRKYGEAILKGLPPLPLVRDSATPVN